MSRHDEHGDVDVAAPEHGPEWWAMGQEFCTCEHPYDLHGSEGHCQAEGCSCPGWTPLESTMATGDEPSSRQSQV